MSRPAATISGVVFSALASSGSAPASTSTCMASTSVTLAARKNAVAPSRLRRLRCPSCMPLRVIPRVDVDAARQHLADDVDAVHAAGRDRPRLAEADVHAPRAYRLVQRVPARAGEVRVGPAVEQVVGHRPVRVRDGDDQDALAVRQGGVHVGAGLEQRADRFEVPAPGGEHERREPGHRRHGEDVPPGRRLRPRRRCARRFRRRPRRARERPARGRARPPTSAASARASRRAR